MGRRYNRRARSFDESLRAPVVIRVSPICPTDLRHARCSRRCYRCRSPRAAAGRRTADSCGATGAAHAPPAFEEQGERGRELADDSLVRGAEGATGLSPRQLHDREDVPLRVCYRNGEKASRRSAVTRIHRRIEERLVLHIRGAQHLTGSHDVPRDPAIGRDPDLPRSAVVARAEGPQLALSFANTRPAFVADREAKRSRWRLPARRFGLRSSVQENPLPAR
jgi:hypothetical protein